MGNLLHREAQLIYKKNNPNSVSEFPIVYQIENDGETLIIKGSVDIVDFEEGINPDFKTASMYTFPNSEYEVSPTYNTQVTLYTYILNEFVFRPIWYRAEALRIVYFKKHNATTLEQPIMYTDEKGEKYYDEFITRILYLDNCLRDREVPQAEPMKWCKYCHKLDYCLERGDLIRVKDGRKKRIIKND